MFRKRKTEQNPGFLCPLALPGNGMLSMMAAQVNEFNGFKGEHYAVLMEHMPFEDLIASEDAILDMSQFCLKYGTGQAYGVDSIDEEEYRIPFHAAGDVNTLDAEIMSLESAYHQTLERIQEISNERQLQHTEHLLMYVDGEPEFKEQLLLATWCHPGRYMGIRQKKFRELRELLELAETAISMERGFTDTMEVVYHRSKWENGDMVYGNRSDENDVHTVNTPKRKDSHGAWVTQQKEVRFSHSAIAWLNARFEITSRNNRTITGGQVRGTPIRGKVVELPLNYMNTPT